MLLKQSRSKIKVTVKDGNDIILDIEDYAVYPCWYLPNHSENVNSHNFHRENFPENLLLSTSSSHPPQPRHPCLGKWET